MDRSIGGISFFLFSASRRALDGSPSGGGEEEVLVERLPLLGSPGVPLGADGNEFMLQEGGELRGKDGGTLQIVKTFTKWKKYWTVK